MGEEKRGFVFKTDKGNFYFYNDKTGYVEKAIIPKEKIMYGEATFKYMKVSESDTKSVLSNLVTKQLILNITEDCNMRCKYCVYSGMYTNNRIHSKKYMNVITAEKAVLKYLSQFKVSRKYDISGQPIISFFGGEPLLNFRLIKAVVELVKKHYEGDVIYTITTNGTVLNNEITDFFVQNNFDVTVSVNGAKKEHDRLRVFEDGTGSYDIIEKKLKYIFEKYPSFYSEKVYFSVVYDTGTDILGLEDFFSKEKLFKNKLGSFSEVVSSFTDWYEQYEIGEKEKFVRRRNTLKEKFVESIYEENAISPVLRKMFSDMLILILNRKFGERDNRLPILPFTGACIPGTKISVRYNGDLYLCEKVNCANPIGNVDEWLNYKKIGSLLNEYNKVGEKCINCPIRFLCPLCYRLLLDGEGKINLSELNNCEKLIRQFMDGFRTIYSIMEDGKDVYKIFFEKKNAVEKNN